MSYILEGLKKLEQKRRQEESPARSPGFQGRKYPKSKETDSLALPPFYRSASQCRNHRLVDWSLAIRGPIHAASPGWSRPYGQTGFRLQSLLNLKTRARPVLKKESPPPKIINEHPKRPALEKTKESAAPAVKKSPASKSTSVNHTGFYLNPSHP